MSRLASGTTILCFINSSQHCGSYSVLDQLERPSTPKTWFHAHRLAATAAAQAASTNTVELRSEISCCEISGRKFAPILMRRASSSCQSSLMHQDTEAMVVSSGCRRNARPACNIARDCGTTPQFLLQSTCTGYARWFVSAAVLLITEFVLAPSPHCSKHVQCQLLRSSYVKEQLGMILHRRVSGRHFLKG